LRHKRKQEGYGGYHLSLPDKRGRGLFPSSFVHSFLKERTKELPTQKSRTYFQL